MQLTGSQIVLECLKEQGVDTIFGYPGGTILNIYDELYKQGDDFLHILTSHEQGAAHAAQSHLLWCVLQWEYALLQVDRAQPTL